MLRCFHIYSGWDDCRVLAENEGEALKIAKYFGYKHPICLGAYKAEIAYDGKGIPVLTKPITWK